MPKVIRYNQLVSLARQHGFKAVGSLSISKINRNYEKFKFKDLLPDNTKSLITLFHPYPQLKSETSFYDYPGDIELAYFAQIIDYHVVVKQRISELANFLTVKTGLEHSWWGVDNHPLPEKKLAQLSKIGFKGRNKLLILPDFGSFGALALLASPLKVKLKNKNYIKQNNFTQMMSAEKYCKNCRRCIKNCPVSALEIGEELDKNRCISALTQKKGRLSWKLAADMSNHFWGCDICQRVCPYNDRKNSNNGDKNDSELLIEGWPGIGDLTVKEILLMHTREMPQGWNNFVFTWLGSRIIIRNMLIVLANNRIPFYQDIINDICSHDSSVLRYYAYFCLYRWYWKLDKKSAKEFLKEKAFQESDKINKRVLNEIASCKGEFN